MNLFHVPVSRTNFFTPRATPVWIITPQELREWLREPANPYFIMGINDLTGSITTLHQGHAIDCHREGVSLVVPAPQVVDREALNYLSLYLVPRVHARDFIAFIEDINVRTHKGITQFSPESLRLHQQELRMLAQRQH